MIVETTTPVHKKSVRRLGNLTNMKIHQRSAGHVLFPTKGGALMNTLTQYPGAPNGPKKVLITYVRPQSKYHLYTGSPRTTETQQFPNNPSTTWAAAIKQDIQNRFKQTVPRVQNTCLPYGITFLSIHRVSSRPLYWLSAWDLRMTVRCPTVV